MWCGLATDHVLTRSVRDSAAMLDATAGRDIGALYHVPTPDRPFLEDVSIDPGKLRIAFTSKPFLPTSVHPDCIQALEGTVKLCESLGHEMIEASIQIDSRAFANAFLTVVCGETRATLEEDEAIVGHKATSRDFEVGTWVLALLGEQFGAADFSKANRLLHRIARQVGQSFEDYDVLLTPTLPVPPLVVGALQPKGSQLTAAKLLGGLNAGWAIRRFAGIDALASRIFEFMAFTMLLNATGQPAVSVPLQWNNEGLPIGMQFVGRHGDEATLFRLAGQLERARPWADRIPAICSKTNETKLG